MRIRSLLRTPIYCLFLVAALALVFTVSPATAQERANDPSRPSANGLTEGTANGVDISITYGRPKVNNREIWGGLVPYGKVWRAGANEATTITFSKDTSFGGENVAAGTYGLFVVPEEGKWTFVLNSVANQWGAFNYDKSKDVVRTDITPTSSEPTEEMTFEITDDKVVLLWADMAGAVPIG